MLATFAPQLYIPHGITDISFYTAALGATVLRTFTNEDGSIHVAELSIGDSLFHLHEENPAAGLYHPGTHKGTTVLIGLFVPDVDTVIADALAAGATLLSPAQDYDYGYRQATIQDPFGHRWTLQTRL